MAKNKKWSAAAKFEIALKAIQGDITLNEICTRYQVAPSQVHAWKKQVLEQGSDIFDKKSAKVKHKTLAEQEGKQKRLYETIGQLTVERDFLKKSWEKFHEKGDES